MSRSLFPLLPAALSRPPPIPTALFVRAAYGLRSTGAPAKRMPAAPADPMDVVMETTPLVTAPTSAPTSAPSSAPASASASSPATPTEPRRRNRPALSCIQCRTRKIRCDRMEPCASCLKSKIVNCTYEEARRPKPRLWRLSPTADPDSPTSDGHFPRFAAGTGTGTGTGFAFQSSSSAAGLRYASSAASLPGIGSSETTSVSSTSGPPTELSQPPGSTAALEDRVRQLEQQLADAMKRQDPGPQHRVVPSQQARGLAISGQGGIRGAVHPREDYWTNRPKFVSRALILASSSAFLACSLYLAVMAALRLRTLSANAPS